MIKIKKRIMYHITSKKDLPSILKYGLIPKKPSYNTPKELDYKYAKGVYLTTKKSEYNDSIITLKVKVSGLNLKKDKNLELKSSYYVEEAISPERIILPKLNKEVSEKDLIKQDKKLIKKIDTASKIVLKEDEKLFKELAKK